MLRQGISRPLFPGQQHFCLVGAKYRRIIGVIGNQALGIFKTGGADKFPLLVGEIADHQQPGSLILPDIGKYLLILRGQQVKSPWLITGVVFRSRISF